MRATGKVVALLIGTSGSFACDKPPRKVEAFSEPFSVSVEGNDTVPGFEVAMMLTKGAEPAPLVQPSTTLMVSALKSCANKDDKAEHRYAAEIALKQGATEVRSATSENTFEQCLGEAMKTAKVEWPSLPAPITMRVELRLSKRSGT